MVEIDLLTILDKPHSVDYLHYLNKTLNSNLIKINYKIISKIDVPFAKCFNPEINLNQGSGSHAAGLEFLTKKAETSYFIICDYDVAILQKNWDQILLSQLDKYVAVGTEYPVSYNKYVGFPTLFFSAWNTKVWQTLNPNLNKNALNIPNADVGCALPVYYQGLESNCWKCGDYKGLETYFVDNIPFVTHMGRGSTRDFSHPKSVWWRKTIEEIQ